MNDSIVIEADEVAPKANGHNDARFNNFIQESRHDPSDEMPHSRNDLEHVPFDCDYTFHDHYTLNAPSTLVRFGETAIRIIANHNHQILLNQSYDPQSHHSSITIQRVADGSNGSELFLRCVITLVAAFFTSKKKRETMLDHEPLGCCRSFECRVVAQ